MIGQHGAFMPWVQVPATGLAETLRGFVWQKPDSGSAARDTAALMIYVAFLYVRKEQKVADVQPGESQTSRHIAELTYDDIEQAVGLSRTLIQQGLQRLYSAGLVQPEGSKQRRTYLLAWPPGRWFKLPCRAMVGQSGIDAFKNFSMRSKHELNALKLYLYLASVRDHNNLYSEVSYEIISQRIGVAERDIRRALNVLNASGLMARINRESDRLNSTWGPNQYYLRGYSDLMIGAAG